MCGIAIVSINKLYRDKIEWAGVRELVYNLALENERRGYHATGLAAIRNNPRDSEVVKAPISASIAIDRPHFQDFISSIDKDTRFVLIHTRKTTTGSNRILENIQPIILPNLILIHNGELFGLSKTYKELGVKKTRSDSYLLASWVSKKLRRKNELTSIMEKAMETFSGAMTGAAYSPVFPDKLTVFCFGRPLSYATVLGGGLWVASSLSSGLISALCKAGYDDPVVVDHFEDGDVAEISSGRVVSKRAVL